MCGVAGFLQAEAMDREQAGALLARMGATLARRGPDGHGTWYDPEAGIGLAHRRLAVVDLSERGAQPMTSPSGRYVISYNGEIYNHLDLRARLPGPWSGGSDTETLLAAIDAWGLQPTLNALAGMFAFALWDRQERTLILARDRLGEKPLYYGWQGAGGRRAFLFGSQLSALRAHPAFEGEVAHEAAASVMWRGCVAGDLSIYRGVRKLPPGATLSVRLGQDSAGIEPYWSGAAAAERAGSAPAGLSDAAATDALEALLEEVVGRQLVADVPLGIFLSGGIDSSTVAAVARKASSRPINTFSIGFQEAGFDEAPAARAVAEHIGADHTELYVTSADALAVIPQLPSIYDEPFADSSQIPTYLLCKLARQNLTVALTGDGGDELFAGYRRHLFTGRFWPKAKAAPAMLRRAAANALLATPLDALDGGLSLLPARRRPAARDIHKAAAMFGAASVEAFYLRATSQLDPGVHPMAQGGGFRESLPALPPRLSDTERVMAWDMLGYLPDDILVKVDRAGMAASLETRAPFLDHKVVEFAWNLPLSMKLRGSTTKWILREVLYRHVPRELVERPKAGFAIPLAQWLRGPLRDWAESLLSEESLRREGLLDPHVTRRLWADHLQGRRDWQQPLWNALMLQAWMVARREVSLHRAD